MTSGSVGAPGLGPVPASTSATAASGDDVTVNVPGVSALTVWARDPYERAVEQYALDLFDETGRYEGDHNRGTGQSGQFTSRNVQDAIHSLRERDRSRASRMPIALIIQKLLVYLCTFCLIPVASAQWQSEKTLWISSESWLIVFVVTLGVAIALSILIEYGPNKGSRR